MSEAGIEEVAVTLNVKPLALNSDTGKVAWRQDPTSKAPTLENANSGDSLDWEIGWKSSLLKNNHLEKSSQVQLPRHMEATKALACVGRTTFWLSKTMYQHFLHGFVDMQNQRFMGS